MYLPLNQTVDSLGYSIWMYLTYGQWNDLYHIPCMLMWELGFFSAGSMTLGMSMNTRPGKRLHSELENHHLSKGISTINGPFSIAMLNYQRVSGYLWISMNIYEYLEISWNRDTPSSHPFEWHFPWNRPSIHLGIHTIYGIPHFFRWGLGTQDLDPKSVGDLHGVRWI